MKPKACYDKEREDRDREYLESEISVDHAIALWLACMLVTLIFEFLGV